MTGDPHQFRAGDRPTPFSAAEIRDHCVPGRTVRSLIVEGAGEPYVGVTRFVSGDDEGADQEFWRETPDGTRLTEPQRRRSTWLEFQGHASMPADTTEIAEEEIEIPAGRYACLRYARRDDDGVSTFWFARSAPGMPLRFEERGLDGELVYASVAIRDEITD